MADAQLKQKTAKGLLWGGIGSSAVQVLGLVFGIFLARLLSPSDYGVVGALTIFSAIAGLFSESGFILAIVNKRKVNDDDYNAVFWFNVVASLSLYALLFFLAPLIANFYHTPEMVSLARFLFLSFVLGALSGAPTAYFFRNLLVKQRSQIQIFAIVFSGVTGVICASFGMGYWGIAIQTVLYSGMNSLLLWIICPWRPRFSFKKNNLISMLPFSLKQLATSLFLHFNNNFFSVLLGRFYGLKITGYYTQGNKWTTMGYSTIGGMINSVGQPVFRQTVDDNERLRRVFRKMVRFAAFLSFPAMFGLAIIAEPLITIAITDKWLPCVRVMQILCISGAFMPFSTLYSNLFNSINRPDIYMWNTIGLGVLQVGCLIASYPFGLNIMLMVYTAINILWLLVWQFFARKHIGIKPLEFLRDISPYFILSVGIMGITEYAMHTIDNPWLSLSGKIAMAASLYIGILWCVGSTILKESTSYIFNRKKNI